VGFGGAADFTYYGMTTSLDEMLQRQARLTAKNIKMNLENSLTAASSSTVPGDSVMPLVPSSFRSQFEQEEHVDHLDIVNAVDGISLASPADSNSEIPDSIKTSLLSALAQEQSVALLPSALHAYWAAFSVRPATEDLAGIFLCQADETVLSHLHTLTMRFYLLGLGGIVAALVLAMLATRVLRLPVAPIEKALDSLENKKYSYRIRLNKNDELYEVYEKFNKTLNHIQKLNAAQQISANARNIAQKDLHTFSRYLDIMAHEVRNPIHAMGINLDVLKTKVQQEKPKADTMKHVRILEREIEHLQQVIQGFMTYARPEVPRKGRTKLNPIINEVCQMARAEATKSKVRIETRLGKNLRDLKVDREQIKRSLHNIVINAIQASKEQGKIIIRSNANRGRLNVSVKDDGEGIGKEQLKKIFDLYYTTKSNGTGLGLPVTRRIIQANGGHIQIDSKPGQGTRVSITLPSL
jgi:signal transduction histidine kinase